jgi:hypothetical protein
MIREVTENPEFKIAMRFCFSVTSEYSQKERFLDAQFKNLNNFNLDDSIKFSVLNLNRSNRFLKFYFSTSFGF